MLNSQLKQENIDRFNRSVEKYDIEVNNTKNKSIDLFKERQRTFQAIEEVEILVNEFANTPKEFQKKLQDIKVNVSSFSNDVSEIAKKSNDSVKRSSNVAVSGALVGTSITALAPTAAMGIATTFGIASTGTPIATLSGAAATKAALAWLGGGAIATGGGGISAGSAFLALAGPVGWTISGLSLVGSIFMASSSNKKISEEALKKALEVESEILKFSRMNKEIDEIKKLTQEHRRGINRQYRKIARKKHNDFNSLTIDEQYELGSLVNNVKALSELLIRTIDFS